MIYYFFQESSQKGVISKKVAKTPLKITFLGDKNRKLATFLEISFTYILEQIKMVLCSNLNI